jgi:hypothetical protein
MEILKIKSPSTTRYGLVFYRRANQAFVDIHFGKVCWMVAFMGVIKNGK